MFCTQCAAELPDHAKFCHKCAASAKPRRTSHTRTIVLTGTLIIVVLFIVVAIGFQSTVSPNEMTYRQAAASENNAVSKVPPSLPEPPSQADDSLQYQSYSISYVWYLARAGARWTGTRWVPLTVGEDPSRYAPLPKGVRIAVVGQAGQFGSYADVPHLHGVFVSEGERVLLCQTDDESYGALKRAFPKHPVIMLSVHGEYIGAKSFYPVLRPCVIDEITDQWGEPAN